MTRSKTVYLQDNQTLTEWVRAELKDKLSSRNRAVHMAEDIGVANITLHRFLHGKSVKGEFYDKAFNYLLKMNIINYNIGDKVSSYHNPDKIIGTCTDFVQNNTCIEIDGKCWGGKNYFIKANFEDVEYEVVLDNIPPNQIDT